MGIAHSFNEVSNFANQAIVASPSQFVSQEGTAEHYPRYPNFHIIFHVILIDSTGDHEASVGKRAEHLPYEVRSSEAIGRKDLD